MASVTLKEWLEQGPFHLALSSGFFGFFAHAGMVKALFEAGLRPASISGSSAGALVGGMLAAGIEPVDIEKILCSVKRRDFWDPGIGPGLLKGKAFRSILDDVLKGRNFEEAVYPCAFSAHDILGWRCVVLDKGYLAAAVHASCALPLLFQPVRVDGKVLADGGISDRPGLAGAPNGKRILAHHLVSKSPWRMRQPRPPGGEATIALCIQGVPRLGPFKLEIGPNALEHAYRATLKALDEPVHASAGLEGPRSYVVVV